MALRFACALGLCLAACVASAADDASLLRAREAGAALARGNVDQAITLFAEALEDKTLPNERRATILTDRGVAYARRQSPKEAIEDFNRAIQLYPEYAAVYNNRGTVLLSLGVAREALKDFDRALVLAPGYAAAFSNRAGAHMKLGQIDRAIADYSKAITLVPVNPAAFTGRGRAHLAAERPQSAIRDLSRAVSIDARFSAAYRSRAEAKLGISLHDEAIEDFSRAVAFEPRNADLYLLRGGAYLEAGNSASAIRDFTTAVDLNPRSAQSYAERGLAYAKADMFDAALNDFARASELEPRAAKAFAYRAWTYRRQLQPELGLRDVDRALRLDQNSAEAYWARGEIHEAQGRSAPAIADFKKALELDPQLKEATRGLVRLGISAGPEEGEVAGAGVERWRVMHKGRQYVAVSDEFPRLKVDVEMIGKGRPRLLEWEVKRAPFVGIGVLQFHAGVVEGAQGPEEVEQAAIVDLQSNTVVSVETQRRGTKLAQWTWDDGRVVVASADGFKDEFQLRQGKAKEAPPAQPKRYAGDQQKNSPFWSPWGGDQKGRKPKTLFDLLFGK